MNNSNVFASIDDNIIEEIVNKNLDKYVSETLAPGDERRIFANAIIVLLCSVYADLNEKAKLRLLRYAKAEILDCIGERVKCSRIGKSYSTSIERYKLAAPLAINVPIPKGSTVSPDGVLIFETTEAAVIVAGNTYVDVPIIAQTGGNLCNGYGIGTIATQISNVPYISSVENIIETTGGDDGEPYPLSDEHPDGDDGTGDNNYRERIRKAPAGFSTAGPEEAYEYFALSADASIEDVKVSSEHEAGRIDLTVMVKDTKIPTKEILDKVLAKCSDKSVRPMNDEVHAWAPSIKKYDINLKYYTTESTNADAILAIENKNGAIDQYNNWQCAKITRDINPDKLRTFLVNAGAKRVEITKPVFTDLDVTEHTICYEVTDIENHIFYVASENTQLEHVAAGTEVFEDMWLNIKYKEATENEFTYTGEILDLPKGVGELAMFSGNLNVTHEIEGE